MKATKAASVLIIIVAIVIILIYGQSLMIPFVFALLLWFLVMKIKAVMNMILFVRKHVPNWVKSVFASLLLFSVLGFVVTLLTASINNLTKSYEEYGDNVEEMTTKINETFQIDLSDMLNDFVADFDFGSILESIVSSISGLIGNAFMIVVYLVFVFLEATSFQVKLHAMCKSQEQYDNVRKILKKLEHSITNYLGVKTLVSVLTGALSYVVLLIIGVDSPVFWAFLIFILNFIPNIGSIIGTTFPAIFSLLQFGEFQPFFLILIFVGAIQLVVGNYLEPRIMGNSLNISALVTILALSFWGAIWGITGMFLSVPITVMLVIVFSQFPGTRPIAIMLSEKGKV